MATLTDSDSPDDKHSRLKALAERRNISMNKLFEELSTQALAEFDSEVRFRAVPVGQPRAGPGDPGETGHLLRRESRRRHIVHCGGNATAEIRFLYRRRKPLDHFRQSFVTCNTQDETSTFRITFHAPQIQHPPCNKRSLLLPHVFVKVDMVAVEVQPRSCVNVYRSMISTPAAAMTASAAALLRITVGGEAMKGHVRAIVHRSSHGVVRIPDRRGQRLGRPTIARRLAAYWSAACRAGRGISLDVMQPALTSSRSASRSPAATLAA
ncbi:MAG: hypothetical protein R2851_03995 [Caldilineaceae bacterium]